MRNYDDLTDRERAAMAQKQNINQRLQFSSLDSIAKGARGNLDRDAKVNEGQMNRQLRRELGEQDRAALVEAARLRAGGDARQGAAMIQALENFKTDASAYTQGGGDELGGMASYAIEYGPEWLGDVMRKTQSADMQGLMAQATALDTQLRELVTTGVLSDQDVRNLKPLSLSGTVSPEQIVTRANQIQQMIALRSGIPFAPSGGSTQPASPAAAGGQFVEIDGELYVKE